MDRMSISDETAVRHSISLMATELAEAISRRDAAGAARHVCEDDHVVYISDGMAIRGNEYRQLLERFYAGMKQIDFAWEHMEIRAIDANAGIFTGWARIKQVDAVGVDVTSQAMFTLVYARAKSGWELVTAHKTSLR